MPRDFIYSYPSHHFNSSTVELNFTTPYCFYFLFPQTHSLPLHSTLEYVAAGCIPALTPHSRRNYQGWNSGHNAVHCKGITKSSVTIAPVAPVIWLSPAKLASGATPCSATGIRRLLVEGSERNWSSRNGYRPSKPATAKERDHLTVYQITVRRQSSKHYRLNSTP
jgi:hypothetical protein